MIVASLVYKITNIANGHSYVGWTNKSNAHDRWKIHLQSAKRGQESHFYNAIRKYGVESFIVEELENGEDDDYMKNTREPYWINLFGYYNMTKGGDGGETSTSFKPGNAPHNKAKKSLAQSELKKLYWENWRKENENYKDKWKKYTPKGISEEVKKNRSNKMLKQNLEKLSCPHCGKASNIGNLKRWHFNKCKQYDRNDNS